ncbi:hypothetical protein [Flammeovirga aprica]|uniref:Uncharacterized protein n=1 Tax=Flammeovirga aprica JL-4 TaxID=694437 RepID=A0A7X9P1C4_9BACT|nr:hypothetical protein [Flammeovirga aprica]NME67207.1 hypothetical protein [Flammeovirga aprica JL-4]
MNKLEEIISSEATINSEIERIKKAKEITCIKECLSRAQVLTIDKDVKSYGIVKEKNRITMNVYFEDGTKETITSDLLDQTIINQCIQNDFALIEADIENQIEAL